MQYRFILAWDPAKDEEIYIAIASYMYAFVSYHFALHIKENFSMTWIIPVLYHGYMHDCDSIFPTAHLNFVPTVSL